MAEFADPWRCVALLKNGKECQARATAFESNLSLGFCKNHNPKTYALPKFQKPVPPIRENHYKFKDYAEFMGIGDLPSEGMSVYTLDHDTYCGLCDDRVPAGKGLHRLAGTKWICWPCAAQNKGTMWSAGKPVRR